MDSNLLEILLLEFVPGNGTSLDRRRNTKASLEELAATALFLIENSMSKVDKQNELISIVAI